MFLICLSLSQDFLNNNWKADAVKESIYKTQENCDVSATLEDNKDHFYFIKLQDMFQMCRDLIKFCDTSKVKNKREFKATQKWEKEELLLLINRSVLSDIINSHQKFKVNMISSSVKHQTLKIRNSLRGSASKKQKWNLKSFKLTS